MKKRGFTLIELLVVISIIGLLSSIVFASLNTARQKGRDAQRKATLRQIYTAMELYAEDNNGNYVATQGWFMNRDSGGNDNINDLTPIYMSIVPDDPLHKPSLQPSYLHYLKNYSIDCSGWTADAKKWAIYAKLERPSASDIATITEGDDYDRCVYALVPSLNYKVGN